MGCCYSSFEQEEMVSRCKSRKRYMKHLVKARHAFSISHIMYLRSLKNTGAALLQLATAQTTLHHHSPPPQTPPPQPPPSPPPPLSPTSEAETSSTTYTESTPRPPPSPPLRSSTWDACAWDPFMLPTRSDGEEWEDMSTTVNGSSEMAVVVVAAKSKDLVEIVKELDEYFLRAADSGGKVSELLEVPVCSISGQGSSGKVHGYGKNLSPLFGSTSKLNVFVKFGCDDASGVGAVGGGGSHCSTVERLYAWEKKLYQEVKNVDSLKIEHAKRAEQLRKMKLKGANYLKTEKAKKEVEKLESKMMVSSQAIESASDEIVKLREEELYPQLVDLVKELMGMWRSLYESHQVQMHIVQQLKYLHVLPSANPATELLRQAVVQLEVEVQQWHLSFCSLIQSQRDYVQSLTGWLRLSLFQYMQTPLSKTKQDPAIYTLCEEWQRVVDNAPDKGASEGIKALLSTVHAIVVQQAEEQKQKKRVESCFKELEKKTVELQALERKFGSFSGSSSGKDPVGDKRAKVEMLRVKTDEERGKYEKSIGVTRSMTLSNLQIGLPHVFQAVTGFANVLTQVFESVYKHAKMPEEVHDVKRPML